MEDHTQIACAVFAEMCVVEKALDLHINAVLIYLCWEFILK